ncbi:response regulator [Bacteroidetes/Chlorobi group bacterium Naka2016]|jgi:response regulator RpfG family c-di-GMP phosphodiesterase|nr:MAG: response regulator [Bacteroidetes/Chlorobi group bacterium Naka2016]
MGNGETANKKGNLLIVDDDINFLKLLEKSLSKHFNIATARSGPEALEIIQKGFNPGVILTDLNMPVMNGIDFLKETLKYVPNSIRIILSAFANPQEIIAAINQSKAYMYLMKPVDQLQLIQILKNAFETYNLIVQNTHLLATLRKMGISDEKKLDIITQSPSVKTAQLVASEFVFSLGKLLSMAEKYYFTNHTSYVVAIAKALAKELKFTERTIEEITLAATLINLPMLVMPKRFLLYDPYDLEQSDNKFFFTLYQEAIDTLSLIEIIKGPITILSQIWENRAGSGGPNHLEGQAVLREAQVIAIANIYHNRVYRIQPFQVTKLEEEGLVVQTKEETFNRHNEAIKFFYRKANWFDSDVHNTFQDMVKKRAIPELVFPKTNLVIRNFDLRTLRSVELDKDLTEIPSEAEEEKGQAETQPIEREIRVEKLKPGMIVAQNIVTKTGIVIVRQDNRLDEALIENIKYLAETGLLPKQISVYAVPPPNLSEEQKNTQET